MISHPRRVVRGGAFAAATAALVALLAVGTASPAVAGPDDITLTPNSQTVEYGQSWDFQGTIPVWSTCTDGPCNTGTMTFTSGSITRTIPNYGMYAGSFDFGDEYLLPQTDLGAGTHTFTLSFMDSMGPISTTTSPATITITPAAIVTTTTIVPDANNTSNAIITSALTGKFVDQLPSCQCEDQNGYLLPAGTWKLTVTDSSGHTVLTKSEDQSAGGLPTFVNYWQNVPSGQTFSAVTSFTPSSGAANFDFSTQKFSWTSDKSTSGGGVIEPSSTPKPTSVKTAGFVAPTIVFWLVLAIALILAALNILLLVRRRRMPSTAPDGSEGSNR